MVKEEKEEDFKSTDTIDVGAGETGLSPKTEEDKEEKEEKSTDAPEKEESEDKESDSEIEALRAKLEKAEAEKDNYKKGLLSSKKKLKSLEPELKKEEEKDENEWDDESSKFQKETLDKSKEYAKEALYEVHSKTAIQKFVATYPETDKAELWKDIAGAYTARRGKDSVENIISDIEDAYLIVKRDRGELASIDDVLKSEQLGYLKAQTADLGSVKGKGGKTEKAPEKGAVSQGAIDMAKAFRHDPEKVAKENDKTTAEIEI